MPIYVIEGPPKSGKSFLANTLRNTAISQGRGALLVDDFQEGELRHQLEKILVAIEFPDKPTPAAALPWKRDPIIIFVNDKQKVLSEFEKLAPGFTAKFGPVTKLTGTAG